MRQVFKGGNYSRKKISFFSVIFGGVNSLNYCHKLVLDICYEAHLKVKLTCNYTLISLTLHIKKIMYLI